jgi:hypothetical protein
MPARSRPSLRLYGSPPAYLCARSRPEHDSITQQTCFLENANIASLVLLSRKAERGWQTTEFCWLEG